MVRSHHSVAFGSCKGSYDSINPISKWVQLSILYLLTTGFPGAPKHVEMMSFAATHASSPCHFVNAGCMMPVWDAEFQ